MAWIGAVALVIGCRTEMIPSSRVRGMILTSAGAPLGDAYVILDAHVPTGIDAPRLIVLGTSRSRDDGSFEMEFPARRVVRILGKDVTYDLRVFHAEGWPVAQGLRDLPTEPIRTELGPRPDGHPAIPEDCQMLCVNLAHADCRRLALEYFGASDVCDFRY